MRKATKSERYKYVRHDPDGEHILGWSQRTKHRMNKALVLPWIAVPLFRSGVLGAGKLIHGSKRFATEREAALFVDKWFLSHGREPVNILVRKP